MPVILVPLVAIPTLFIVGLWGTTYIMQYH
jgi:hypothetical protein